MNVTNRYVSGLSSKSRQEAIEFKESSEINTLLIKKLERKIWDTAKYNNHTVSYFEVIITNIEERFCDTKFLRQYYNYFLQVYNVELVTVINKENVYVKVIPLKYKKLIDHRNKSEKRDTYRKEEPIKKSNFTGYKDVFVDLKQRVAEV